MLGFIGGPQAIAALRARLGIFGVIGGEKDRDVRDCIKEAIECGKQVIAISAIVKRAFQES